MKRVVLLLLAVLMVFFAACGGNSPSDEPPPPDGIFMTTVTTGAGETRDLILYVEDDPNFELGDVSIDWGDGTDAEPVSFSEDIAVMSHTYTNPGTYTINIEGFENLLGVNCSGTSLTSLTVRGASRLWTLDCKSSNLTSLNVSENEKLMMLDCRYNDLTSLDVSENDALEYLYCDDNLLDADALRALFATLPDYSEDDDMQGSISFFGNPGYDGEGEDDTIGSEDTLIYEDKDWWSGE